MPYFCTVHKVTDVIPNHIDVFRFTFYWTLIFHSLFFLITGGIACFNIVYPSRHDKHGVSSRSSTRENRPQLVAPHSMIPLTPVTSARSPDRLLSGIPDVVKLEMPRTPQPRKNVHCSRFTYALFTLLTFLVLALAASFVESAVIGYVLWAVFHAGNFNISTWV
jgi:hypothetical protein